MQLQAVSAKLSRWLPVRLIVYLLTFMAIVVFAKIMTKLLVPPTLSPLHAPLTMLSNLALVGIMFSVYAVLVRVLEHRAAHELGIRRAAPAFLIGSLLGIVLMGTVFTILFLLGAAHFAVGSGSTGLANAVLHPTVAALLEELLFRVVLFRIIQQIGGTSVGIVLSAVIFGISHAVNPGASPLDIAAIALEAGVLLSLAYALTRTIWLAAGIHMGWNFAEAFVFGTQVSGQGEPYSLLRTSLSGSRLLTGGGFGPEGSMVALIICFAASVILCVLLLRKGHWERRRFRLRSEFYGCPDKITASS